MTTIQKYQLQFDKNPIMLPTNYKVLSVGFQSNIPTIWVMCNTSLLAIQVDFYIYGTGFEITEKDLNYAGTAQMPMLVLHVFYKNAE